MRKSIEGQRKHFPILKRKIHGKKLVYLDNAATTQKPEQVLRALQSFYTESNANIHRGVYPLSEQATLAYEGAREKIAAFVGAKKEEVVFTRGATESLNLLAYSLPSIIHGRNEIVLSEMEHHANLVPWQQLAKRKGWKLRFIPLKKDYTLNYTAARRLITRKTAVVSVAHISNALGTIHDVKKLAKLTQSKGAFFVIDAAQSIAHMPLSVRALGCDFLVFSGHKMYGPTGIGVLYGRHDLLNRMDPFLFGGDMIRRVTLHTSDWNDVPTKFEAGTPPIAEAVALGAAVDYLHNIGMKNIRSYEENLLRHARKILQKVPKIKLLVPPLRHGSGIISFTIPGIHTHDIASLLSDDGVCIRGGHHCAMPLMEKLGVQGTSRLSIAFYNAKEDIDELVRSLIKIQKMWSSG